MQRWQRTQAAKGDQRPSGKRRYVCPPNKLREKERQAVMAMLNIEAFKDLPPSQVVPRLADSGLYIASKSTMYRPQLPVKPFENLLAARRWVTELAHWYNHEHRHSAIGFVTPAQRHGSLDRGLLEQRALVYKRARQENPQRGSGQPRQ